MAGLLAAFTILYVSFPRRIDGTQLYLHWSVMNYAYIHLAVGSARCDILVGASLIVLHLSHYVQHCLEQSELSSSYCSHFTGVAWLWTWAILHCANNLSEKFLRHIDTQ